MSKCKEVKNPCKICFQPVNRKTGLQCQGACKSWVHYSCLNYTPGKIQDIKKGIISVVCPCPDCKTSLVKEFRTDIFTCDKAGCPANRTPSCGKKKCPTYDDYDDCIPRTCGKKCRKSLKLPTSDDSLNDKPCPKDKLSGQDDDVLSPKCAVCPRRNGISIAPKKNKGDYENEAMPLQAVEQICNTVGQLANQLNDLVDKMQTMTDAGKSGKKGTDCKHLK